MALVPRPLTKSRGRVALLALAVTTAGLVVSGCDVQENADTARGRLLFNTKCGVCHTLAEAGSTAQVGPSLDAAFAAARSVGMDQDTIEGVVQTQIESPRVTRKGEPDYAQTYMPAGLVEGQDAEDVATYVASVAGVPGIKPPQAPGGPGGQVFANNGCGSCHTLEAAESSGNVGPNLDEVLPGDTSAQIQKSIVDPGAEIAKGFDNVMPATFGDTISASDLKLLVMFLLDSAGKPAE